MDNRSIGILDSGVGGLSVWREIVTKLPLEATVYIADSKNCPYGNKTAGEIYHLAKQLVGFLQQQNVKLVVVACNTITASAIHLLRADFPALPIVGIVPVVKTAVKETRNNRIGVLSTKVTAKSQYQKNLIATFAKDCQVVNIGLDSLVPLVEKGEVSGEGIHTILTKELVPFTEKQIDTLALGCSHYPFLKKAIEEVLGPSIRLLDSGGAVARQVKRVLKGNSALSLSGKPVYTFYTTGNALQFGIIADKLLGGMYTRREKKIEGVIL